MIERILEWRVGSPEPAREKMINRGILFFEKASHFFQNFTHRDIFFSNKRLFRCLPDLTVDTIVGADFVGNEVNPE